VHNQQILYDYSLMNGMILISEIYWKPKYTLRIYGKDDSFPELQRISSNSKEKNNIGEKEYFIKYGLFAPPWKYWCE